MSCPGPRSLPASGDTATLPRSAGGGWNGISAADRSAPPLGGPMSNPISDLILGLPDLIAQVPARLQPAIVALAGAAPFIEGEGAAAIGIIGGIHPVAAALAGAVGNFLCVALVVLAGARVRTAVTTRVGGGAGGHDEQPISARREKFQR